MLSISLVVTSNVEARLKYYRYNANIPMVEMSLNMMVAMGVLEQIPGRLVHDGNPYNRAVTARHGRYSRHSYDYPLRARYSDDYLYDDYWGGSDDYWGGPINRYSRYYDGLYGYSPDPWYRGRFNRWDRSWGSRYDDPWYGYGGWGNQLYSPWGNAWKYQWMNPWSSPWASSLVNPYSGLYGNLDGWPLTPGYQGSPLSPDSLFGDNQLDNGSSNSAGPSSKQPGNNKGYSVDEISWSGYPAQAYPAKANYGHSAYSSSNGNPYRKTNGLWIGENGEMLGIRDNQFLWYGGNNQYANGELLKSPTMMEARTDGSNKVFRFQYRFLENQLVTISMSGDLRTYNRMPLRQARQFPTKPSASYSSYKPELPTPNTSYSRYRSDNDGSGMATPLTSYPGNASATAGLNSTYESRRGDSVAAVKPYSRETPYLSQPVDSYAGNKLPKDTSPVSGLAGKGNAVDVRVSSSRDVNIATEPEMNADSALVNRLWNNFTPATNNAFSSRDATTGSASKMSYQREPATTHIYGSVDSNDAAVNGTSEANDSWMPKSPYTTYGSYPAFPQTTYPAQNQESSAAITPSSNTGYSQVQPSAAYTGKKTYLTRRDSYRSDELNPDTYLYSYMKDTNNTHTAAASNSTDNFNIWKPNNSFGQRQADNGVGRFSNSDGDTEQARPRVRKFVWSDSASWN